MPKKRPANPFKKISSSAPLACPEELKRREASAALPADLKVDFEERLGKGANNVVYKGSFGGTTVALRLPVAGADTQSFERAEKEAALMLKASTLHAGPKILDLWFCRHGAGRVRSGLGAVMEVLDFELHKVLENWDAGEANQVVDGTLRCINSLAASGIVLTDLKPQNVMVRPALRGASPTVRIIDYGSEFAEAPFPPFKQTECPLLGYICELVPGDQRLRQHLIATAMLVQLSATNARDMHQRFQNKQTRPVKTPVNALAAATAKHLDTMRLSNIALLRKILRKEQFRSILRHYHGRHNSGTRRTLRFARGNV